MQIDAREKHDLIYKYMIASRDICPWSKKEKIKKRLCLLWRGRHSDLYFKSDVAPCLMYFNINVIDILSRYKFIYL